MHFNCIVQDSLYHNMDIGTMWHCALVSCTPSHSIGLFLGVRCPGVECHYVLLLLLIFLREFYFIMIFIIFVTIIGISGICEIDLLRSPYREVVCGGNVADIRKGLPAHFIIMRQLVRATPLRLVTKEKDVFQLIEATWRIYELANLAITVSDKGLSSVWQCWRIELLSNELP